MRILNTTSIQYKSLGNQTSIIPNKISFRILLLVNINSRIKLMFLWMQSFLWRRTFVCTFSMSQLYDPSNQMVLIEYISSIFLETGLIVRSTCPRYINLVLDTFNYCLHRPSPFRLTPRQKLARSWADLHEVLAKTIFMGLGLIYILEKVENQEENLLELSSCHVIVWTLDCEYVSTKHCSLSYQFVRTCKI